MTDTKTRIVLSAVDQTKAAFDSVQGSLGRLSGGFGSLNGAIGRFLPLIGVATFTSFIKGGIDAADAMNDLSDRTGIAVDTLAGLEFVAKLGDTNLDTLGKGVNRLSIFMAENAERARELGLTAKEPIDAYIQFADTLANMEDVSKRNSIANEVLSRSYIEQLPVLLQGSDALRARIERGKELNPVNAEGARQAGIFNDRMDELSAGAKGAGIAFANDLLPSVNQIVAKFLEASKETNTFTGAFRALIETGEIALFGSEDTQKQNRFDSLQKSIKIAGNELIELDDQIKAFGSGRNSIDSGDSDSDKLSQVALTENFFKKRAEIYAQSLELQQLARDLNRNVAVPSALGEEPEIKGTKTKSPTESLREQLALLQQENNLVAQGVPLEDAKTIAKLKQQGITDDLIVQNLNLNQIARQLADEEKAASDAKTKAIKDEADAQKIMQDAIKKGDEERANFMKEQGERDILGANLREKITTDLQSQTDALNFQLSIQGLSTEEQQKQQALRMAALEFEQALNELNQAGVYLNEEETAALQAKYDELARLNGQLAKTNSASKDVGLIFKSTFEDAVADGAELSDVLKGLEQDLIRLLTRRTITEPLMRGVDDLLNGIDFGGIFGALFNANGNAFDSKGVVPFAKGGVVDQATPFMFANGGRLGVMGEAGPEAILPLSRGANGKLGVQSSGIGGATVTVNIIGAAEQPQVQQRDDGNGNTNIDIIFDAVKGALVKDIRSEGNFAQAMQGQYGLNRAAGAR